MKFFIDLWTRAKKKSLFLFGYEIYVETLLKYPV